MTGDVSTPHEALEESLTGRTQSQHSRHPGGLHWEPVIMLTLGHKEAISS